MHAIHTDRRGSNFGPASIVEGYAQMVQERIDLGFEPTLLTFMFNQLPGSRSAKIAEMTRVVERTYATALSRIVRRPRKCALGALPFWVVCADWPVPKRGERDHYRDLAVNDGLHMHAVALVPPDSRLRESLEEHFDVWNQHLYSPPQGPLHRIEARGIERTPEKAVRYVLKSLTRARIGSGDVFVLPRTHDEVA